MRPLAYCFLALIWIVIPADSVWSSCGDHLAHLAYGDTVHSVVVQFHVAPEDRPVSPCAAGNCKGIPSPLDPATTSNMDKCVHINRLDADSEHKASGPYSSWDLCPPIQPSIDLATPPPRS